MTQLRQKATHANVHATEMCFGGFRATVMSGKTVVASCHFGSKGWGQQHVEDSWKSMKTWLAGFGVA